MRVRADGVAQVWIVGVAEGGKVSSAQQNDVDRQRSVDQREHGKIERSDMWPRHVVPFLRSDGLSSPFPSSRRRGRLWRQADFASSSPCPSRTNASNVFGFAPPI